MTEADAGMELVRLLDGKCMISTDRQRSQFDDIFMVT